MGTRLSRVLSSLEHFLAVAEELHFGRAAERLGTTQPPLSRRISNLEIELGVTLFRRNRNLVELTDAGLELKRGAGAMLDDAKQMFDQLRRIDQGIGGLLRVGFVSSALYSALPQIVIRFNKLNPSIELSLQELSTLDQIRRLANNELDVGLVRSPGHDVALESHARFIEPLMVMLKGDHPLAGMDAIHMHQLKNEPFITYSRQNIPRLNDVVAQMCEAAGFTPNVVQEANQIPTIISFVSAGLGVALVPSTTMRHAGAEAKCVPLLPRRNVRLDVVSRRRNQSPLVAAFAEAAQQVEAEGYGHNPFQA